MIDVKSEVTILTKHDSQYIPGAPPGEIIKKFEENPSPPMSPAEWGIINVVIYSPKDVSLLRQVVQGGQNKPSLDDKLIAKILLSLGEKVLSKKKFSKAGRLFVASKTMDPTLIDAHIRYAETYVKRNNYEKAIKILRCAIRNNPQKVALLQYSAGLAEFEGDYARLAFFERLMLEEDPQDSRTYLNLLQLLTDHAKFEQFVEIADSLPLPDMDQRNLFRAYNLLVNGYEEMKQYEKALYYADAALAIKPKRLALWEAKANIYQKLGQNKEALECLQQMVRIKPHAKAYNENAFIFGKKHHLL